MNNVTIQLKIKQRLNKLASNDYDNIEPWQIIEAFDKGTVAWARRQLHGLNVKQTGDEQSKRRIDDLQILLTEVDIPLRKRDGYYESTNQLPADYFEWKRIAGKATSDCCKEGRNMVITLAEEANVDEVNRDYYRQPVRIEVVGILNPYTGLISTVEVESEFKDDIVELLVDEAAKILAGDIESFNQSQVATQQVEGNN